MTAPVTAPVIIYDAAMNKAAYLPRAFGISYTLRANEVGTASFSVPLDDEHLSEITAQRFAELWNGDTRIELFRIIKETKGHDYVRFDCEHALATLNDDEFAATTYAGAVAGTSAALTAILASQAVARWTLGTCDFSEDFLYEWARGTKLLRAVLDVPGRFQAGYFFTFSTATYPWTLNLIAPPSTPTAYIDYGRNAKELAREADYSDLVTKLYPHGAGSGVDQIGITTVEPGGLAYITRNVATYGTLTRHWTDQRYTTEAQLYAAAVDLLVTLAEPKMTYTISAADLVRITNESIDTFTIGALVTVTDSILGIDVSVRVMSLTKSDVTGAPGDVTLELANKGEEFDFSAAEQVNVNDLSNIDVSNIPGGTPGALPGAPTGTGLFVSTDYLGYYDSGWKTYMDSTGRLYASDGTYWFDFNPVLGTLSIKVSALDISATTGIVDTLQLADLAVTDAKIETLSVAKLTTGTIDAETITLAETTGSAICQGKTGPSDTDPGFWLGYAAGASMFTIGDATNYMKWTGTQLIVVGDITGTIAADLNMSGHALYNCTDFRGGTDAYPHCLNIDNDEWLGYSTDGTVANSSYLLLTENVSLKGYTDVTVEAQRGDLYLYAYDDLYFDIGGSSPMQVTAWVTTGGALGAGEITVVIGGATRKITFTT
jgi:phage minor structural protein